MPLSTLGSRVDSPVYTITGTATAVANGLHIVNLAASLGAVVITLPATPPNGTKVQFLRIDGNSYTSFANITRATADGGGISFNLAFNGGSVTLVFYSGAWYPFDVGITGASSLLGMASTATYPPNMMSRDSSGRSQVAAPSAGADITNKTYVDAHRSPNSTVAVTGSVTATANAVHMCTLTGAATATLPAAPADGTVCEFVRLDGILANLTIQPGGTDTLSGASPFVLRAPNAVRLIYNAATTAWAQESNTINGFSGILSAVATATAGTIMTRDTNGRSAVADPSATGDIATKNYVDTAKTTLHTITATTYTASVNDLVLANCASNNITVTIPNTLGAQVVVKKIDTTTNTVTVVANSGTIDGDANCTLSGVDASAVFLGDGTNVQIIAIYGAPEVAVVPTGSIQMYGASTAPAGWLLCDGSSFSSVTYPALATVLGDTYGTHSGTTYYLPNFTNMFPRGNTPSTGGGADTHTHTSAAHSHTLSDAGQAQVSIAVQSSPAVFLRRVTATSWTAGQQAAATGQGSTQAQTVGAALTGSTDSATPGSTGSANNIPAYEGVAFIIKT